MSSWPSAPSLPLAPSSKAATDNLRLVKYAFHDLIQSLWPRDDSYLSDAELEAERTQSLALMSSIVTDGPVDPTYRQAVHVDNPERDAWLTAIKKELDTLSSRGTWTLVPREQMRSHRKKPVRHKFVLKKKMIKNGTVQYKARLVACGYTQVAGQDFSSDELYASVCSYSSMRFLMSMATQRNFILYQTDITAAYLESYLDDEIYMDVPMDLYINGRPPRNEHGQELICQLKRGLYGLKQSGYAWAQTFQEFILRDPDYKMDFKQMTGEQNLYRKVLVHNGITHELYVGQYVDDCLLAASSSWILDWFLERLKKRFPVNPSSSGQITVDNPGLLLSMNVTYDQPKGILRFDQRRAIEALTTKLQLDLTKCHRTLPISSSTDLPKLDLAEISSIDYLSVIGSCLHISQVSRPDCAFAVGVLSRHSATPGQIHMDAAHDLVRYMYRTRYWSIQYMRTLSDKAPDIYSGSYNPNCDPIIHFDEKSVALSPSITRSIEDRLVSALPPLIANNPVVYCDADLAGDRYSKRSTSGQVILMNGGPISWSSRQQDELCAQSSAESEIYAVTDNVKEALHLRLLCEESGIRPPGLPMTVWEDNNACIHLGHNLRGSQQAKHYQLRLRFLNEHIWENNIEFSRVNTADQLADGFTKPLPKIAFERFRAAVMVDPGKDPL